MDKTSINEANVHKNASIKTVGLNSLHSPSHDIRKQQASVFDWMTPTKDDKEANPPTWFFNFMENYKEELVAEISAKVVQSLGVVIDNKLSGLEKKNPVSNKQQEKVVIGKAKKSRDTEKVKKEAMRMTMNINDEAESKELKKLRKSLKKKTDKVVKIAMKIEKKQNQEDKHRKPSISSTSGSEVGINFHSTKKEKKCKKKTNRKVKEEEVVNAGDETTEQVVKKEEPEGTAESKSVAEKPKEESDEKQNGDTPEENKDESKKDITEASGEAEPSKQADPSPEAANEVSSPEKVEENAETKQDYTVI